MSTCHFTNFYNISYSSDLWQDCLKEIRVSCQADHLYENYLDIRPENYLFFNGVICKDKIVAFGAIEHSPSKWSKSIARVLTRFWIHPDFRGHSLTKWTEKKIKMTPLVLKPQLDFLKNHNDIEVAMITRQGKHYRWLRQFLKITNLVDNCKFQIVDGIYNVCEPMEQVPESCKQKIMILPLKNINWNLYQASLDNKGLLKRLA